MKVGDFIKMDFSGKIKESGQDFDSQNDLLIIVGAGYVIPGLDKEIEKADVGDKKSIEITPEEAFGPRKPELVRLVPLEEFKRHGTKPYPGMIVDADNMRGRVLSVASGRVKVDFNHPLAGKVLVYEFSVKERVEKLDEKIKGVLNFYTRMETENIKVKENEKEKEIEITVPPTIHPVLKKKVAGDIHKYLGFKKVKFSEIFEDIKKEVEKDD